MQCHMVDWRLRAIREHPTAKRYWSKVMVYDERPPVVQLSGIYVGMPRQSFNPRLQRAWGYFRLPETTAPAQEPDLLYSFLGSATHSCRTELFKLRHPDAVVEEVQGFMFWDPRSSNFDAAGPVTGSSSRSQISPVSSRQRHVIVSDL